MIKLTVEAPEINEQIRKLANFDKIAQQELTSAMRSALLISQADIRDKAPVGATGQLRASIRGQIKYAAGDEVRGVMTAEARNGNFPYGYALDVAFKKRQYRYRGRRKKTKGYFRGVIFRKRREVFNLFAVALNRVVNRLQVK